MDRLADRLRIRLKKIPFKKLKLGRGDFKAKRIWLAKPLTFMNRSGKVVKFLTNTAEFNPEQMVVVCDNLDLSPGNCRLKKGGSSGGHNGLASIIQATGTVDFMRIYIGVGRPGNKQEVIDYLLNVPKDSEKERIGVGIEKAVEAILMLCEQEAQKVMNVFNRREKGS